MDKDLSQFSEAQFLSTDELRSLLEFQKNEISDLRFSNRILDYENKMQMAHIKLQNSQLEKLQEEIENFRGTPAAQDAKPSTADRLRAKILRLNEKLCGNSAAGEARKWKLYRKYEKCGLVFSAEFFSYLFMQNVLKNLCSTDDTGLRVPGNIPKTSIILQVDDHVANAVRCLEIFFQSPPQIPFEIIVTGNAKNLAGLARIYPSVKVVKATDKAGLCARAEGEYLLFINENFALAAAAADELACALFRTPDAGAIGGQVFHGTSGKLLESGTILCGSGELIRHGFGGDPSEMSVNFFRECDLLTHPVFITRKSTFSRSSAAGSAQFIAGSLSAGRQNYVMPLAKILFFGDDNGVDHTVYRDFHPDDALLASRRWKSREDWENGSKFAKPAIFYLDAEIPKPDRGSGGMDVIFFVEYMLKRGYHVLFYGENTPEFVPKYTPMLQRMGVECFTGGERAFIEYIAANGRYFDFAFVSRVYQAQSFDIVIRKYMPQAVYIFNTVDVHFVREKLEAQLHNSADEMLRAVMIEQVELTVMARSDAVIVISSDEKKMLENDHGIGNCFHIPQAREIAGRKNTLAERAGMVFIGSAHPPNLDALQHYVQDILPLLKAQNIDGTLTVIGEALRDEIFAREDMKMVAECPEINFVGFVEDLGDCLNSARLTIAPLRYGAGTKGKVASSMSYGVPCISSAFGTEGTGMEDGENILIAGNAEEFAAAISRLLTDDGLWQKISDGGLRFLEENYATASVEKKMDELWSAAVSRRRMKSELFPEVSAGSFPQSVCGSFDPETLMDKVLYRDHAVILLEAENVPDEKLLKRYPGLKHNPNILLENKRFDFIILTDALKDDARDVLRFTHAFKLLFDGGKLLVPFDPAGMKSDRFFHLVKEELYVQSIGYSSVFNAFILTKAIPSSGKLICEN